MVDLEERFAWEETPIGKRFIKNPLVAWNAIRAKCLDCCCAQREEVKLCLSEGTGEGCPLYKYRKAREERPKRAKIGGSLPVLRERDGGFSDTDSKCDQNPEGGIK